MRVNAEAHKTRKTGPSPEVIRPEKEGTEFTAEGINAPDIQEQNLRELHSIPINQEITAEEIFKNPELQQKNLNAEQFEEKLQEIDRDIGLFNSNPESFPKNIQTTGKGDILDPLSTADVEKGRTYSLPDQPSLSLSVKPDVLSVTGNCESKWKRITRACVGIDVVMEEAVGTKRTTRHTADLLGMILTENNEPELFGWVVWDLWNRRNNLRLGKAVYTFSQLLQKAVERKLEAQAPHQTRSAIAATRAHRRDTKCSTGISNF
nr:hypothetical protein CFP56_35673 [Quercus suber]